MAGSDEAARAEEHHVVLVHGLLGSTRWWRRNLGPLAADGRLRVHAVDLEGFGARGRSGRFQIDRAVDGLLRWMDVRGLDRASLVGHSLGGLVVAQLAATVPERVDRLVLVDAAMLSYDPGIVRRVPALLQETRALSIAFSPVLGLDMLRAHPLSLASAVLALRSLDWSWTLARIAAPTLVVWGERDRLVPLAVGRRIAAAIPGARLEVIPGAGHNVMWEAPDAFNRTLLTFLTDPNP